METESRAGAAEIAALLGFRFLSKEEDVSEPIQETKAQRAERLKGALNPWAAYAEIERFARDGVGSIPPEWPGTYFRRVGIYPQGDGGGCGPRQGAGAPPG